MHHIVQGYRLRMPEPGDIEALYEQKNDWEISAGLGGFSTGYAKADLAQWVESHRVRRDEVLWVIAHEDTDMAVGHVGLYQIDHRVGKAEFAILIGDRRAWGKGLGRAATAFVVRYGFEDLNLRRISLDVLESNVRAQRLYRSVGFQEEGRQRQAQYKNGRYLDVVLMAILRDEWKVHA